MTGEEPIEDEELPGWWKPELLSEEQRSARVRHGWRIAAGVIMGFGAASALSGIVGLWAYDGVPNWMRLLMTGVTVFWLGGFLYWLRRQK